MRDFSALILAGGRNSRMDGKNKAMLSCGGRSFIEIIMNELSAFGEIIISADSAEKYAHIGVVCAEDIYKGAGPLGGIHAGLIGCKSEYLLVTACDTPNVSGALFSYICSFAREGYDAVAAAAGAGKVHPLCAVYSKRCLPVIERMLRDKEYRLTALLEKVNTKYAVLEDAGFDEALLANINTTGDYRKFMEKDGR